MVFMNGKQFYLIKYGLCVCVCGMCWNWSVMCAMVGNVIILEVLPGKNCSCL